MENILNQDLLLWYEKPAEVWEEALPIGSGRLGAMIFGNSVYERLQINEDTIWTGKPHDYAHEGAYKSLDKLRNLLASGNQSEAEALAAKEFMSIPLRQKAYQPFCDLFLDFIGIDEDQVNGYRRYLDLEHAVAGVVFNYRNVKFRREYFASYPHQSICLHCQADKQGQISFRVRLTSQHPNIEVIEQADGLLLQGEVEPEGIQFAANLKVLAKGGKVGVQRDNEHLYFEVRGADCATLLFVGASSFEYYNNIGGDPQLKCRNYLAQLDRLTYSDIKHEHIRDYQKLFKKMSIKIGDQVVNLPTNQRIKEYGSRKDPQLAALYLQYARYLMISGSRPKTMPLNLQGLWNDQLNPPWGSKYTCNINLEMNYWLSEPANLAVCHQPLFDMLDVLHKTGRRVAAEHYNCRGWVLHHNTDIWGGSAPINHANHGIWPTGGAWLACHLWQHYHYGQDRAFLQAYYPILRDACLFFVDFLVEDPKTGWLISTPSNSPEQGGLVAGPTMDHQIIRALFTNFIQAADILECDCQLSATVKQMINRIAPNQIGRLGQLQEWLADIDDPENKHRHVSHLWGLYPGNEISRHTNEKLSNAARRSLEFRGDKGTGWSMAWKICLWARLEDGDHAYRLLTRLFTEGTYPNLFDAHPPFQIDGNFGAATGIIEMLVQSHLGYIRLLPALPKAWTQGSITGVCTRGGFIVDLTWDQGKLTSAVITSQVGGKCKLAYDQPFDIYNDENLPVKLHMDEELVFFNTEKGCTYRLMY